MRYRLCETELDNKWGIKGSKSKNLALMAFHADSGGFQYYYGEPYLKNSLAPNDVK